MQNLPDKMLAGVSGGADSVALLRLLVQSGVQVTAVHVNHGLRGEASDSDEAFVRELCERWKVPLRVYRAEPPENPGEEWAREARYAFYRQAAEETGVHAIALAHHRDDQAETLLLHLLRGSGLTGLTGMAADTTIKGLRILRPLLNCSREELQTFLRELGQPWREDASNADPRYLRNAVRRDILPRLEALIPGAAARLAGTADVLREENAVLDGLTRAFLDRYNGGRCLPLKELRGEPTALKRRILRAWWGQETGDFAGRGLSAAQTGALTALIDAQQPGKCNLPGGWTGQAGWTHLHLAPPERMGLRETPLEDSHFVRICPANGQTGDGRMSQAFARDALEGLTVRSRQPGDWLRPFGSRGRQSLQDYFVNRRVDAPFRDQVPLICRGSEVLLVGGVGAGDIPRTEDVDDAVLLCWTTAFPWHRK